MAPLTLTVAPFEGTDPQAVADLVHDLSTLVLKVAQVEALAIPANSYDADRGQYLARIMLEAVERVRGQHVVGVTDLDLYAGDLNFVFGLAQLPGKAAVVSLHRLRRGADRHAFRLRAVKEVVHELGHSLGLHHCPDPRCVMYFSNSLADTDRRSVDYCASCRAKLHETARQFATHRGRKDG